MRVVILVPRREGIADRDRLWEFTRRWWEGQFPDWPIVIGHHDIGLFNRSAAVNAAARLAGDWDIAVLIDSDILLDADAVHRAVPLAVESGQMVVPFEVRHNLSPLGTKRILEGDRGSWRSYISRSYRDQHSACVVIPRTLYDDIGGFDEGFRGWGFEDSAFAMACELFAGLPLVRIHPGELWHLHHGTNKGEKHGSPSHRANAERMERHRLACAAGDRPAVQGLVREGREANDPVADTIPAILHRVVPESTPQVAEDWWAEFGRLHPDWRLMTHRDPLDPAEWPLTSPHWRKVANGVQLADLVRLEALLRFGGVYVDMDVQPFRSFEPLRGAEVFAAWEDERTIPNAIMGSRPDHPIIRECLKLAVARMHKGIWEAGPGVTTEVFKRHPEVLLLPPGSLYAVHYRDPDRDTKMVLPPAPWEFARHAYWGSWLEPERQRVPA